MKEPMGIILGILGLIFCAGNAVNAFGDGHFIIAGLWVIGAILSLALANDALDAVDNGDVIIM